MPVPASPAAQALALPLRSLTWHNLAYNGTAAQSVVNGRLSQPPLLPALTQAPTPLPSPGTNWPVMRSNGMAGAVGRQEVEVAGTSLPLHPYRPPHLSKGLVRERAPARSGFGALILSLTLC